MVAERPRILLVDSYDSFTYKQVPVIPLLGLTALKGLFTSLAALCRQSIPDCSIHIIKNDHFTLAEITPFLTSFSAIIVGPGPGSPENLQDIGIVRDLWKLKDKDLIPIFGVCLGLQSLCVEFGGRLKKLAVVKHGQVSQIFHQGADIFKDVGDVHAVRYHSLHVQLAEDGDIQQLAWADDGSENGRVVMAARHKFRPIWAVQYHPESVCTKGGGAEVLHNFWHLAIDWAIIQGRTPQPWTSTLSRTFGPPWPHVNLQSPPTFPRQCSLLKVTTEILNLPDLSITTICELLGALHEPSHFVLLDSAAQPGHYSIMASFTPTSPQITYLVGDSYVRVKKGDTFSREQLGSHDIWSWIASFMRGRKAHGGSIDSPFWGGLIGYLSYELGVHSLPVHLNGRSKEREAPDHHPDLNLIFVERSFVFDSGSGNLYLQSLIPDDDEWFSDMMTMLNKAAFGSPVTTNLSVPLANGQRAIPSTVPQIIFPDKALYKSRIRRAKEHLFNGDSYELCLTARTLVSIPKRESACCSNFTSSSWERYKHLRVSNPAPHSAYLRLHPSTLLSSSPERFLSFTRPPGTMCQLRPIKGTVRKSLGVTRAVAEKILAGSTKEVAENLMIVDLIRHDLHGVLGEDVRVKQFCGVEEYETVWQLVSVVEGQLSESSVDGPHLDNGELGWEVLGRSLPPGSMTGAPKKRSVEILQTLEDHDRSLYSGVFGYWCVGGGGDFSVTIRSCFKYDNRWANKINGKTNERAGVYGESPPEAALADAENWVIGAGGAITALSDPEAEWQEMVVKLQSVLRAFGVSDILI